MMFFDLEFYVPPSGRNNPLTKNTLIFEPTNPNHKLLGGYFVRKPISKYEEGDCEEYSYWLWNYDSEKQLTEDIFNLFKKEYETQSAKKLKIWHRTVRDIITCGFGISRIDLPTLFIKSQQYQISNPAERALYFLKTRAIDLGNVSAFLFSEDDTLYPKTADEVASRILTNHVEKQPGKNVWKEYDSGEFDAIEIRCKTEVEEIIKIYDYLRKKIGNNQFSQYQT